MTGLTILEDGSDDVSPPYRNVPFPSAGPKFWTEIEKELERHGDVELTLHLYDFPQKTTTFVINSIIYYYVLYHSGVIYYIY